MRSGRPDPTAPIAHCQKMRSVRPDPTAPVAHRQRRFGPAGPIRRPPSPPVHSGEFAGHSGGFTGHSGEFAGHR
eukprot:4200701-Pyramimonas_sp.AAC.1